MSIREQKREQRKENKERKARVAAQQWEDDKASFKCFWTRPFGHAFNEKGECVACPKQRMFG